MAKTVDIIIDLMNKQGLNAHQLEVGAQLSNASIQAWSNGKAKPSVDALIKVADYFGVSVDYLLGRSVSSDIIERPDYSISNDFAVNYEDIIKERAFNDLAKLYKAVDSSMRAQMLVVIATYLHRSGIDTESIVGY